MPVFSSSFRSCIRLVIRGNFEIVLSDGASPYFDFSLLSSLGVERVPLFYTPSVNQME